MSILNVNKLAPIGSGSTITVAAGIASYTGKINCAEFDNNPSFTGNVTIGGNLGVAGTITYEDVARVDATGISTFREGYQVGPLTGIALTAYKDGSIRTTGIITASSFVGDVTGEVNASKFDTNPSGVVVTGVATATAFIPSQGQLSNRNLIINGAMSVAQRGTSSTANGYATVDRFRNSISGNDEAPTQAQHALTSSDTGPWEKGFRYSYHITNGNQTSGAGAADYINPKQLIEAQNIANSGWNYTSTSSYITISFWVKSSVAQNFYGNIRTNDGTDYNYVWETGALSANTWTKITKTIPGNSNLQFDNNNGNGLEVYPVRCFDGTDRTASMSLNTWAAHSNSSRTPDQTSTWYTTNDATLEFTGVQLEVGSVATPFEHRSYNDELVQCERYYQTTYHGSTQDQPRMDLGFAASDTQVQSVHHYRTIMRDTPNPTQAGAFRVDGNTTKDVTSITFTYVSNVSCQVNYFTGAGLGGNNPYIIRGHSDADARLNFDAEL